MNTTIASEAIEVLRRKLLDRQRALLDDVDGIEADLRIIEEGGEPELEGQAQGNAMARLLDRVREHDRHELEQIYRALAKIPGGVYGLCEKCGEPVAVERLDATPAARYCIDCQTRMEAAPPVSSRMSAPRAHRAIPVDYGDLDDAELAAVVRERIREHLDPDFDEVQVRCRSGVVRLSGDVPSEGQRDVLVQIVADGMGLEVLDRLRVVALDRERSGEPVPPEEEAPVDERIPAGRGMQPLAPERWVVPEDEAEPAETAPDTPIPEKE